MRVILILLFFSLLSQTAHGLNIDHVTFNDKPHRVLYTGVIGSLIDEYESMLAHVWSAELEYRYDNGVYDSFEYLNEVRNAELIFSDARDGKWWDRPWHMSLECSPRMLTVISGPSRDIINLGFARITSKWRFKLNEYEADIAPRYGDSGHIVSGWKFKFSPLAEPSIKFPFLVRASVGFKFTWIESGIQLIHVGINVGYKAHKNEMFIEVTASLVQW